MLLVVVVFAIVAQIATAILNTTFVSRAFALLTLLYNFKMLLLLCFVRTALSKTFPHFSVFLSFLPLFAPILVENKMVQIVLLLMSSDKWHLASQPSPSQPPLLLSANVLFL